MRNWASTIWRNGRAGKAPHGAPENGFSLLEVMIAVGIFFVAIFSILELTSQNLRLARSLQTPPIDPSSMAAFLSLTNSLEEGAESGDFGDLYPNVTWAREVYEVGTNGLWQVDFVFSWTREKTPVESKMSILLYRPNSGGIIRGRARGR